MEKVDAQICVISFYTLADIFYSRYVERNRNTIDGQNDRFVFSI